MNQRLPHLHLSRRESQVMDVLYRLRTASVAEVVRELPDDPGYNTIRNTLTILERKRYVTHRRDGNRYVYAPAEAPDAVRESAVHHLVQTFFQGSAPNAVLALLGTADQRLSTADLDEIARYVEKVRREARS